MPITQAVNSKANIKKSTNNDVPFLPQFPVVSRTPVNQTTAAQTVFNLGFSVDTTNPDSFLFVLDGKTLSPGASNDFQFTAVNSSGYSSQVTLNVGFPTVPVNLNWFALNLGVKKEAEFNMDNRFVQLYESLDKGFQGFVVVPNIVPTTTPGAPAAGTFYSTIVNRAPIQDLSQDLRVGGGHIRIPTVACFPLQVEFGTSNEMVWGIAGDEKSQIKLVGAWSTAADSSGQYVSTVTTNDYIEVVFNGTGLDILIVPAASMDIRSTVDGGTESSNLAVAYNTTLNARNYNSNTVVTVASGLTLGNHTVRIRNNAAAGIKLSGVQVMHGQTTIQANPGSAYSQGKKIILSAGTSFAPSTGVTGIRGGRMLTYLGADGTLGRSFQATNAAQANLTSADHTNEEVARIYHFREFGANRSDDFSTASGSSGARAFTLEDGVTSLSSDAAFQSSTVTGLLGDSIAPTSTSSFLTFTFIGTGLDIVAGGTQTDNFNIFVDGSSIGSGVSLSNSGAKTFKIVSGLPYGTHSVRITRAVTSAGEPGIQKFIVYQPKKPALPSGAIELCDYNVVATYAANATAGIETIATGVARKSSTRELIYVGTWTTAMAASSDPTGWYVSSGTQNSYWQHTFYGTGIEARFGTATVSDTWQFTLTDVANPAGTTNLTAAGATTSFYGAGVTSFTASTGNLVTSTSSVAGNGARISGLPLGWHTIKLTKTSATGGTLLLNCVDVITPIHSHVSNVNYDQQNTLPIGSQGISDNRKFTPVKDINLQKKNISQAFGIVNNPTTTVTSGPVVMPDMSVVHTNTTGRIRITANTVLVNSATSGVYVLPYIDGVSAMHNPNAQYRISGTNASMATFSVTYYVTPGTHKIDLYWYVGGGTGTALGIDRSLVVEEI